MSELKTIALELLEMWAEEYEEATTHHYAEVPQEDRQEQVRQYADYKARIEAAEPESP